MTSMAASPLRHWVRAWRLPAQLNLFFPALLGLQLFASCSATLADLPVATALGLSFLLQWVIMTSNEAADAATDDVHARTLISGGAGVGAEGALTPQALRRAAFAGAALGLAAAFVLAPPAVMLAWAAALALVWAYDGPLHLSRRPHGALCQAVGVGWVAPLLAAWQIQPWRLPSAADALLGLLLGLSGHILTALPDLAVDRRMGKRTLAVCLGRRRARGLMLLGFGLAAGLLATGLPTARCQAAGTPLAATEAALLVATAGLLAAAAPAGAWQQRMLAGLPRHVWLTAMAAILLWLVWIARTG